MVVGVVPLAGLLLCTALSASDDSTPPVIDHLPCRTFVPGRPVEVQARIADESTLFEPRIIYRFDPSAPFMPMAMMRSQDGTHFAVAVPSPAEAKVFEYFLEVFDVVGNGPAQVGSSEQPLRLEASGDAAACVQLSTLPSEVVPDVAYLAKVDFGVGVLLSDPQAYQQERLGGGAAAAGGYSLALADSALRALIQAELGWFGFPPNEGKGSGGVGFLALGPGLFLPTNADGDALQLDARVGVGRTGPFWRLIYDFSAAYSFHVGPIEIGPLVKYLQIIDGPEGSSGDANVLQVGLTIGHLERDEMPPPRAPEVVAGLPLEFDRDNDRLHDRVDECPELAEDWDGEADYDGCPEPLDMDADGIADKEDRCPRDPEDQDGFEDQDGCPEPDNDNDGILDGSDLCPLEPGTVANGGCPVRDRDGDGVVDESDQCPDIPGKPPVGCPARVLVVKTAEAIEIREKINFETDTAKITGKTSFLILDQVAAVLTSNPSIWVRIEGHTDDRADDDYNLKLSASRAEAVRDALVSRGIASERLTPVGYGESKPIASNRSEKGRAINRRVEFNIIMEHSQPAAPPPPQ